MTRLALLMCVLATPGFAQTAFTCVVSEKCGKSGMCVAADETVTVTPGEDGTLFVEGIPSRSAVEFFVDDEGRFVWRPNPVESHAPGVDVDQMAVRFAGVCDQ